MFDSVVKWYGWLSYCSKYCNLVFSLKSVTANFTFSFDKAHSTKQAMSPVYGQDHRFRPTDYCPFLTNAYCCCYGNFWIDYPSCLTKYTCTCLSRVEPSVRGHPVLAHGINLTDNSYLFLFLLASSFFQPRTILSFNKLSGLSLAKCAKVATIPFSAVYLLSKLSFLYLQMGIMFSSSGFHHMFDSCIEEECTSGPFSSKNFTCWRLWFNLRNFNNVIIHEIFMEIFCGPLKDHENHENCSLHS